MNVYDFDKTIFYPDSMILFAKFCIRRHPSLLRGYFPKLVKTACQYARGKCSITKVHAALNSIIRYLDDPDADIAAFWKRYERNFSAWYLLQKKSDDLIISASPEYLLRPVIEKLGVNFIGTIVDREIGVMIGNVCLAKEKAKYIIGKDMPVIDNFYSDSLSDTPIALLAEKAFIVRDKARSPEPWPHLTPEVLGKVHKKIDI